MYVMHNYMFDDVGIFFCAITSVSYDSVIIVVISCCNFLLNEHIHSNSKLQVTVIHFRQRYPDASLYINFRTGKWKIDEYGEHL